MGARHRDVDRVMHRFDASMHSLGHIGNAVVYVGLDELAIELFCKIGGGQVTAAEQGINPAVQRWVHAGCIGVEQLIKMRVRRNIAAFQQIKRGICISECAFEFVIRHGVPQPGCALAERHQRVGVSSRES